MFACGVKRFFKSSPLKRLVNAGRAAEIISCHELNPGAVTSKKFFLRRRMMTNQRTTALTITAVFLVMLLLPATQASAQVNDPWWGRDRDHSRDDRNRRDNYYDYRALRDSARRVHDRSRSFQHNIDRLLDNSRLDDTRREDRINEDVRDLREAAARFRDRVGDGRNLNRSANEARALLQSAQRVDRYASRIRLNARAHADWSIITHDLRTIARIYGFRFHAFDGDGPRGNNDRGWRWPF